MGLDEEDTTSEDVRCILCSMADENETTGALSSKEGVSAHQNCLIFSSGIFCKSSPSFDDLFGFDVADVRKECNRGKKLKCFRCGRPGATAGCEVGKCKRSYHYPCAIKDKARLVENGKDGFFTLYCEKHDPERPRNEANDSRSSVPGSNGTKRPRLDDSLAGASSESDSGTPLRTPFRKRKVIRSDSGEPDDWFAPLEKSQTTPPKPRDQSTPVPDDERNNEEPRATTSGEPERMCVPLEIDLTQTTPPKPRDQSTPVPDDERNNEEPRASTSGGVPTEHGDDTDLDEDAQSPSLLNQEYQHEELAFTVITDSGPSVESENSLGPLSPSLLPASVAAPVCNANASPSAPEDAAPLHAITTTAIIHPPTPSCPALDSPPLGVDATAEPAGSPNPSSPKAPSFEDLDERVARPPPQNTSMPDMSRTPSGCKATPTDRPLDLTSPPGVSTASPPSPEVMEEAIVSETSAALFWRRCNEVGCTEAIFTELTRQISSLAEKVQAQHATQQDYAVSLRILEASGKLPAIFRQLEQGLEKAAAFKVHGFHWMDSPFKAFSLNHAQHQATDYRVVRGHLVLSTEIAIVLYRGIQ
ncbi:hypothetical protein NFI96_033598 [Prochilodus magdalenae]|nr:hypothetical protein NFI96_033598 [Prochilodus magdalenae]